MLLIHPELAVANEPTSSVLLHLALAKLRFRDNLLVGRSSPADGPLLKAVGARRDKASAKMPPSIAAVQFAASPGQAQHNRARALDFIHTAATRDARIVVLPELAVSGCCLDRTLLEPAAEEFERCNTGGLD
jgi:hypothetical protein